VTFRSVTGERADDVRLGDGILHGRGQHLACAGAVGQIQSFDVRPLQIIRKIDPSIKLALLVGNKDGIEKSIEKLGFKPESYSPHFSLLDDATVKYCRENGIKLVPWTVNELADLEKVKAFKPDGVITDYPDRAVKVFRGQ
jgi:glycerophosphoryl diester phosphodiesterase